MFQIFEYVKMALKNIRTNKGRSFLTMLGIIIGISSVILIMSIGNGAKKEISDQLNSLGDGQIYLYSNTNRQAGTVYITEKDVKVVLLTGFPRQLLRVAFVAGNDDCRYSSVSLSDGLQEVYRTHQIDIENVFREIIGAIYIGMGRQMKHQLRFKPGDRPLQFRAVPDVRHDFPGHRGLPILIQTVRLRRKGVSEHLCSQ